MDPKEYFYFAKLKPHPVTGKKVEGWHIEFADTVIGGTIIPGYHLFLLDSAASMFPTILHEGGHHGGIRDEGSAENVFQNGCVKRDYKKEQDLLNPGRPRGPRWPGPRGPDDPPPPPPDDDDDEEPEDDWCEYVPVWRCTHTYPPGGGAGAITCRPGWGWKCFFAMRGTTPRGHRGGGTAPGPLRSNANTGGDRMTETKKRAERSGRFRGYPDGTTLEDVARALGFIPPHRRPEVIARREQMDRERREPETQAAGYPAAGGRDPRRHLYPQPCTW